LLKARFNFVNGYFKSFQMENVRSLVGMSGRALTFLSLSAVITLLLLNTSDAAFCNGKPHPDAKPNLNTIFTADPVFVREVKNAKLYTVGDGDDKISVVHLWGTPYERGFAHGTIMKQDALNMVNSVWEYIVEQVESAINGTLKKFPPKVVDFLATEGLDGAYSAAPLRGPLLIPTQAHFSARMS
jgi:hypothetical protein